MKLTRHGIGIAPLVVLAIMATACSTTDKVVFDEPSESLQAGAATRTITPEGWEPWTDVNGNHVFDGDLNGPDGAVPALACRGIDGTLMDLFARTYADVYAVPEPLRSEWLGSADTVEQIHTASACPHVPLTVIVAGPTNAATAYLELWRETQQDYADMVSESQLLVAERSDHAIPIQQPEIIIDAIVEILQGAS